MFRIAAMLLPKQNLKPQGFASFGDSGVEGFFYRLTLSVTARQKSKSRSDLIKPNAKR
jgi:hypothetical protein